MLILCLILIQFIELLYLDNSEIIKIHFDVVWTVTAGVGHLECQLVATHGFGIRPR